MIILVQVSQKESIPTYTLASVHKNGALTNRVEGTQHTAVVDATDNSVKVTQHTAGTDAADISGD